MALSTDHELNPPSRPPLVTAFAANAPSAGGVLEVLVPSHGGQVSKVAGWAPRTPVTVGEECLVAYDDHGDPWVVAWLSASSAWEPGDLKATARATAPAGWLLCEGQSLLRSEYAALFAAIGTTFGSVDGTHFTLPDYRDASHIGASGTRPRGTKGGATTVKLTTAQLAEHTHASGDANDFITNAVAGGAVGYTGGGATLTHTPKTGSAGNGQAHENMPPFIAGLWLIKT